MADGWADVVISNGVINLCADKAVVFAEIARVLRPGGGRSSPTSPTATRSRRGDARHRPVDRLNRRWAAPCGLAGDARADRIRSTSDRPRVGHLRRRSRGGQRPRLRGLRLPVPCPEAPVNAHQVPSTLVRDRRRGPGQLLLSGRPRRRRRAGGGSTAGPARRFGPPRRAGACGSGSPPTPTCTPTSSPARCSWPSTRARRCSPPRPVAAVPAPWTGRRRRGRPGRAAVARTGHPGPHRRAPVLPAGRRRARRWGVHRRVADRGVCRADRPARRPPQPRSWPAPSTPRCGGWPRCPRTPRSGRPMAPDRSAPLHPGPSAPAPSAGRRPPTRCWASMTRTSSSRELLGSLGSYPPYFRRLGEINRRGPEILDSSTFGGAAGAAGAARSSSWRDRGALVVDVRPVADYAAGHVPGAVSIPLRAQFATLAGLARARRHALIVVRATPTRTSRRSSGRRPRSATTGWSGSSPAGSTAWTAAGQPTRSTAAADRRPARRPAGARHPPAPRVQRRAPARRGTRRARRPRRSRGSAARLHRRW